MFRHRLNPQPDTGIQKSTARKRNPKILPDSGRSPSLVQEKAGNQARRHNRRDIQGG